MNGTILLLAIITVGSKSIAAEAVVEETKQPQAQELTLEKQLDSKINRYLTEFMNKFDQGMEADIEARINSLQLKK